MVEEVIHADNEIVISNFNKMLDDLYKDNDECLVSEDEITVHPKKSPKKPKTQKKKKA